MLPMLYCCTTWGILLLSSFLWFIETSEYICISVFPFFHKLFQVITHARNLSILLDIFFKRSTLLSELPNRSLTALFWPSVIQKGRNNEKKVEFIWRWSTEQSVILSKAKIFQVNDVNLVRVTVLALVSSALYVIWLMLILDKIFQIPLRNENTYTQYLYIVFFTETSNLSLLNITSTVERLFFFFRWLVCCCWLLVVVNLSSRLISNINSLPIIISDSHVC